MERASLIRLLREGYSTRKIAQRTEKSQTTVLYWLKKHNLKSANNQFNQKKRYQCRYCSETDPKCFVNMGNGRKHKSVCKACHSEYTIDRIRGYKRKAVEYKGGKCQECGYNRCIGALEFHHRDPKAKDPSWRLMRIRKFENIKKEIDKCDLLCSNCHREKHWS